MIIIILLTYIYIYIYIFMTTSLLSTLEIVAELLILTQNGNVLDSFEQDFNG